MEIEPTIVSDDLREIRDTNAMDWLYGGNPIGLEEALSSVKMVLERLTTISSEYQKTEPSLPEEMVTELKQYQNFSATYKEEYEWHGVEPGPPKEVVYELGDIVRQKASEILASTEKT